MLGAGGLIGVVMVRLKGWARVGRGWGWLRVGVVTLNHPPIHPLTHSKIDANVCSFFLDLEKFKIIFFFGGGSNFLWVLNPNFQFRKSFS